MGTTVCGQDDDILCIQLSQSSSGGYRRLGNTPVSSQRSHGTSGSKSPARRRAHRATPTRSQAGDLVGRYGVQASATDLEALPLGPNPPPGDSTLGSSVPHSPPRSESKRPVVRPSSRDTGHSARLATKVSVQQSLVNRPVYSEHVPVTPGPGKPGTGQMTGTQCSVSRTTLGKPGAPTTPGSPGRFSSHRSTDQCTLNMYRSHRDPVNPVLVKPGPGARSHRPHRVNRVHRPHRVHRVHQSHRVHRSHWVHWSDQSTLVRNLKRKRPTSAWTGLSFLFLIHRSDWCN